MKPVRNCPCPKRQGSVLVLSLIFVIIFSALAAAMASMSGANVQIAENHRKLDSTRACAESGLEAMRYWMNHVAMSGTTPEDQRFTQLTSDLQTALMAAGITPTVTSTTVTIPEVALDTTTTQSFSAVLTKIDNSTVRLDVTGTYGSLRRKISSNFLFGDRAHNVFDFGLVSRGPMKLTGNLDVTGYTEDSIEVEANAFILSPDSTVALTMEGRSMINGHVTLTDSTKIVDIIGNKAGIGGVTGTSALTNVEHDDTYVDFAEMHPEDFFGYATNIIATNTVSGGVHDNLRIPAGLNPTFSGGATLRGVIMIETPNVVTFGGGTTIIGVVVTNGDPTYDPPPDDPSTTADDLAYPRIIFGSNVNSFGTETLDPALPQFMGLQDLTGTGILAPGFFVEFRGTFGVMNGAIAANGIKIGGGSGGQINGSLINYSNNPMDLSGNGDLIFRATSLDKLPAGFVPELVMYYDPSSYVEEIL